MKIKFKNRSKLKISYTKRNINNKTKNKKEP